MKIAIGYSYSGFELPKWLLDKCNDENFLKVRVNVANYLENNFTDEIDEDKITSEVFKKLLEKNTILKINRKQFSSYCIKKEKPSYDFDSYKIYVADVDTTRPWRIDEYDGWEGIQYLDYDVIDEEFNYCSLKD